jgi:hypothetical protein
MCGLSLGSAERLHGRPRPNGLVPHPRRDELNDRARPANDHEATLLKEHLHAPTRGPGAGQGDKPSRVQGCLVAPRLQGERRGDCTLVPQRHRKLYLIDPHPLRSERASPRAFDVGGDVSLWAGHPDADPLDLRYLQSRAAGGADRARPRRIHMRHDGVVNRRHPLLERQLSHRRRARGAQAGGSGGSWVHQREGGRGGSLPEVHLECARRRERSPRP